jgi:hypothetical protein
MCVLGKRLLRDISIGDCNKNISGPLHQIFCGNSSNCDPYYEANEVSIVRGIKGLSSGVFLGECTLAKLYAWTPFISLLSRRAQSGRWSSFRKCVVGWITYSFNNFFFTCCFIYSIYSWYKIMERYIQ